MAPFHYAAVKDYIETMAVLVAYGADVNIQNAVSLFFI
jgi:ankyrin repeat protein